MSTMIKPFYYEREDTCPICKSERSIEAYTYTDKPLNMSLAIDRKVSLKNKGIAYLKCKNCKEQFFPKWISDIPIPMIDFEFFMNGYKEALKESETG